jgi:hypothetical protein
MFPQFRLNVSCNLLTDNTASLDFMRNIIRPDSHLDCAPNLPLSLATVERLFGKVHASPQLLRRSPHSRNWRPIPSPFLSLKISSSLPLPYHDFGS